MLSISKANTWAIQVEDVLTLVADQGQLVEGGLGRSRFAALNLVLDSLGQLIGEGVNTIHCNKSRLGSLMAVLL